MGSLSNEDLRERLETVPTTIFDKEREILNMQDEYDEMLIQMKIIETNIANAVENEKDETTQKSIYSNQAKRDAETKNRLSANIDYGVLSEKIKKSKRDLELSKITLSFLKRKFRGAESLVKLSEK